MKVLVLAPHPFFQDRGTPMDVELVLRGLSARGETVDVVAYHEGRDISYPGMTLYRIRAFKWLNNVQPGFSFKKLLCDLLMLPLAWRLVRRNRYDVIHAGEESVFFAMLFKLLYCIPYVYDMDSSIAQQVVEKMGFLRPLGWLFNWLEARAIRGSVACAPVCHALADLAESRGAPAWVTLHDISQLKPADFQSTGILREKHGIRGVIGLYVGNLEKYQGIDLLLESLPHALREAEQLQLVIAGGTDADIEKYRAKAVALGVDDHVHFIGRWPSSDLAQLLAEADFLVAPRIKGINTPMKVFPYLHSGRPVLVTDLPTHTQLLDESVAMLGPPDPEGFGRAMSRLVRDPELCERLGRAGRGFVEDNHTYKQYERRLNRLYDLVDRELRQEAPQVHAPV